MGLLALWILERPVGLAALALPLLLLLWARRPTAPLRVATGALELWRSTTDGDPPRTASGARRIPPRTWLLAASLVAGAVAVAGPRRSVPPPQVSWTLELDRSPSMYLPVAAGAAQTRYDLALERALEELERLDAGPEERRWTSSAGESARGATPPRAWAVAPAVAAPELSAGRGDRIPISDRLDPEGLSVTGGVASGGAAVPGIVADSGGRRVLWNGAALVDGGPSPSRRVRVDAGIAAELRELVELWCAERGLSVLDDGGEVALWIEVPPSADERSVRVLAEGWGLRGRARVAAADGDAAWSALDGTPVAWSSGPGRLGVALTQVEAFEGGSAALALDWARWLDAHLLPAADVVPFAERQAAGAARTWSFRTPAAEAGTTQVADAVPAPAAWLSLAALALALAALAPLRKGPAIARSEAPRA